MVADAARREATLRRLGLVPGAADVVRAALEEAVARAGEAHRLAGDPRPAIDALDAGCGRQSALARHRPRLRRFVGVDVHVPAGDVTASLDELVVADVCAEPNAFPPAAFDVVLCSFAVEHLADPPAAFANIARWLRPGGTLVLSTVNRRHPFVAAYLSLPDRLARRVQPLVKASAADAHPLVGACNDPVALRGALAAAGFEDVRVRAVAHLARAWGRHRTTFLAGLAGDLLTRRAPSRRSTLVAVGHVPPAPR